MLESGKNHSHFNNMITKKVFIIPGFKEQASDMQYQGLVSYVKSQGWVPIKVPVTWNYRTLNQNADDFIDFYNKNKSEKNYVLGFSYGSVIALMTANELIPDKIFLCSLSPDFKEDTKSMSSWIKKYIGKNRYKEALNRSGIKLAKELKVPATIFYGEIEGREYPSLKNRCEETALNAKKANLVVVKNTPHRIDTPEYILSLKNKLNL